MQKRKNKWNCETKYLIDLDSKIKIMNRMDFSSVLEYTVNFVGRKNRGRIGMYDDK